MRRVPLLMFLLSLVAIAYSFALAGCATDQPSRRELEDRAAVAAGVNPIAEAIDYADAAIQPTCQTRACLTTWRAKRQAAMESLFQMVARAKGDLQ